VSERPKVAVVGGGVAGLVAGRTLAIGGADVTVFEAAAYVGGRCHRGSEFAFQRGDRIWRFDLEHGIHGLWRQYRNVRRILEEEGKSGALVAAAGQELVVPHPTRGVQAYEFGARVRQAPLPDLLSFLMVFTASDFLAQSLREGPVAWQRSFFDLLHAFAFDARRDIERYDDVSVADFIEGWPLVLQRMSGAITHSAFFREARDVGLAAYLTGLQSYFVSDKRDTAFDFFRDDAEADLLGPLRARIEASGGRVRTGTRVVEIVGEQERAVRVRWRSASSARANSARFDGVVVAVDPPGLARLRDDGGIGSALDPQARIPDGVHSCVVRLFFDRDLAADRAPTGVFHGLAADNFFWLHRLQRPFVAYHAETGGAVLECHLYGDRAVAAASLDDDAVL
jgi:isorenieratene synthase